MENGMRRVLILLFALTVMTTALCPAKTYGADAVQTIELKTPSGAIRGTLSDGIAVYKGIPYAEPPMRFAPPIKVKPWTEVKDCTDFGAIAPQNGGISNTKVTTQSEDCLTLNVWAKSNSANKKLPVYVWIHGGGYANGSGADDKYDGTMFAKEDIVVVTINYRLNAAGFLASGETLRQYGTTGNWGILDQIEALKWIQNNIAAFGGDPGRVTIGGESAGAYSVGALIISPLAKGLFQSAIMESGSALAIAANSQYARGSLEHCIEIGRQLMYTFGANDNAEGLAKMRTVDSEILVQMTPLIPDYTILPAFMLMPVFDGYAMPKNPVEALRKGDVNHVNLLWGFNADEGSLFVSDTTTEAQYKMLAAKIFGYDKSLEVIEKYPIDENNPAYKRARQALMHGMFATIMKPYGDSMHNAGKSVYAYYYSYASPELQKAGMGAMHGSEIEYAFGNLPSEATAEKKTLSKEMFSRWTAFIKNNDPNSKSAPSGVVWEKYDPENGLTMVLDRAVKCVRNPIYDDMAFMENILFGADSNFLK